MSSELWIAGVCSSKFMRRVNDRCWCFVRCMERTWVPVAQTKFVAWLVWEPDWVRCGMYLRLARASTALADSSSTLDAKRVADCWQVGRFAAAVQGVDCYCRTADPEL